MSKDNDPHLPPFPLSYRASGLLMHVTSAGSDRRRLTLAQREHLTNRQSSHDDFLLHTQVKAP